MNINVILVNNRREIAWNTAEGLTTTACLPIYLIIELAVMVLEQKTIFNK